MRKTRIDKRLAFITVILAAVALYFIDPEEWAFVPKCPFKMITGLSCPGCGFQRAVHALLHGETEKAIRFNFFLVYAMPYLVALGLQKWALTGKWQYETGRILESKPVVGFYIITFVIWFAIRNILNI